LGNFGKGWSSACWGKVKQLEVSVSSNPVAGATSFLDLFPKASGAIRLLSQITTHQKQLLSNLTKVPREAWGLPCCCLWKWKLALVHFSILSILFFWVVFVLQNQEDCSEEEYDVHGEVFRHKLTQYEYRLH